MDGLPEVRALLLDPLGFLLTELRVPPQEGGFVDDLEDRGHGGIKHPVNFVVPAFAFQCRRWRGADRTGLCLHVVLLDLFDSLPYTTLEPHHTAQVVPASGSHRGRGGFVEPDIPVTIEPSAGGLAFQTAGSGS